LPSSSHRPRKRFGQHFLHDRRVLAKIVEAIDPQKDELIVEIGPGEGALTRLLLERSPRLQAIELDRDLAARLRQELPALQVHQADALSMDYASFGEGMRLVGNLPYNISTPLLFHLARYAGRVRDMHFMLQLEVVERMVALPSTPQYGRLSVALQTRLRMRKLFNVAAGAFRPAPKVESAFVRLEPLPAAEIPAELDHVLRRAFSARRKTLRNALAGVNFAALQLDARLRPEDLSPQDYLRIATQAKIAS
jgi:16S rRNA (adenine1518-N6/adenine1519-N6)-dimethyltransferase